MNKKTTKDILLSEAKLPEHIASDFARSIEGYRALHPEISALLSVPDFNERGVKPLVKDVIIFAAAEDYTKQAEKFYEIYMQDVDSIPSLITARNSCENKMEQANEDYHATTNPDQKERIMFTLNAMSEKYEDILKLDYSLPTVLETLAALEKDQPAKSKDIVQLYRLCERQLTAAADASLRMQDENDIQNPTKVARQALSGELAALEQMLRNAYLDAAHDIDAFKAEATAHPMLKKIPDAARDELLTIFANNVNPNALEISQAYTDYAALTLNHYTPPSPDAVDTAKANMKLAGRLERSAVAATSQAEAAAKEIVAVRGVSLEKPGKGK